MTAYLCLYVCLSVRPFPNVSAVGRVWYGGLAYTQTNSPEATGQHRCCDPRYEGQRGLQDDLRSSTVIVKGENACDFLSSPSIHRSFHQINRHLIVESTDRHRHRYHGQLTLCCDVSNETIFARPIPQTSRVETKGGRDRNCTLPRSSPPIAWLYWYHDWTMKTSTANKQQQPLSHL